ncbi:MAG: hypothetical protein GF364_13930, partial [Candidatus Lokiarchaeota archaeon]|nr:hypothetical protein [Candidatus Lokiarchaeota archaeon]
QGFGSPSAFSDAQNTTGRPITVVSKHTKFPYGILSQFYTTEKNTKVYVIEPEEVKFDFLHGTYCKLNYLNLKYKRGYVDEYVEKTAMMNSHITLIYIDPYGDQHIYPRRVEYFPKEPKYALPHPSSIKIGDFQDLLRNSENLTVTAFLTDNFVRMSNNLSKKIVSEAEFEIEDKFKMLNLNEGFLSKVKKKSENWIFAREEMRIYGRSKKKRPKIVIYSIPNDGDLRDQLWEEMNDYNTKYSERSSLQKKIKQMEKDVKKVEDSYHRSKQKKQDRKYIKKTNKEIKKQEKEEENLTKLMEKVKNNIDKLLKKREFENEITEEKIVDEVIERINQLMISKTRPAELTRIQIEYLYMSFKNQKYMSPPTDTAIPVGESALETVLIKQFNLQITNKVEYFGDSEDEIYEIDDEEKLETEEKISKVNKVLAKFTSSKYIESKINFDISMPENLVLTPEVYHKYLDKLDVDRTYGDDFVAAETRKPTSGKGLAFVVEAVMAYSPHSKTIKNAKTATQVITRYVNRTPKLRDNTDCALWMGIQSVNWKNYKVPDTFDNGIPKGNFIIYVNCSGPYTHLMFKSQSKNALAEDEVLLSEVKLCLESIGRKLRRYLGKKERRKKRMKRSELINKSIPVFVDSLYSIVKDIPKFKALKVEHLRKPIEEKLERDTLGRKGITTTMKLSKSISAEVSSIKKDLKEEHKRKSKKKSSKKASKKKTSKKSSKKKSSKKKASKKSSKKKISKKKTAKKSTQSKLTTYDITSENVLKALSDDKWHKVPELVKKLKIKDQMEAAFLLNILKKLYIKKQIKLGKNKQGKKVWKINR